MPGKFRYLIYTECNITVISRFFTRISQLPVHDVESTLCINNVRSVLDVISKPMSDLITKKRSIERVVIDKWAMVFILGFFMLLRLVNAKMRLKNFKKRRKRSEWIRFESLPDSLIQSVLLAAVLLPTSTIFKKRTTKSVMLIVTALDRRFFQIFRR